MAARKIGLTSDDQKKIKIAPEYFMRAGQGHADILELLQEDAELYFPKLGLGFGRNSFLEWLRDNWETAGESDGIGPPG